MLEKISNAKEVHVLLGYRLEPICRKSVHIKKIAEIIGNSMTCPFLCYGQIFLLLLLQLAKTSFLNFSSIFVTFF